MMKQQEVIWITGASSGIGKALCEMYAGLGWQVIASSRNQQQLESVFAQSDRICCLACDVADDSSVENVANQIVHLFGYLSHVIVNAGNCEYVDTMPIDTDMFQRLWSVNVMGAVNTVNAALPLLQQSKNCSGIPGHVLAVSSQVIFAPFTRAEMYGASKAAMDYLMQSWRLDLARYEIDVTVVYPGFVDTPLTQKNSFAMPFIQTVEQAAASIHQAIVKRPAKHIFPKRLYACLLLSRIFPKLWQSLMLKGQHAEMQSPAASKAPVLPTQDVL